MHRFFFGIDLQLREAQRTLLQADKRLIYAKFEAKVAETELLRLSGDLGMLLN